MCTLAREGRGPGRNSPLKWEWADPRPPRGVRQWRACRLCAGADEPGRTPTGRCDSVSGAPRRLGRQNGPGGTWGVGWLTKSRGPSRTRGLAAGAIGPSPVGPRPAPPGEGEGSGVGPVSAFPHSLGSRRRWAATALLASWCLSVCFVSDTSGPSLMVRPRASLRYVPRGALTCSTRWEPSGKVRLACGRIRVSRQGEGEPGLSVLVVSQNAEDSDRTERASRSVPRPATRPSCSGPDELSRKHPVPIQVQVDRHTAI